MIIDIKIPIFIYIEGNEAGKKLLYVLQIHIK